MLKVSDVDLPHSKKPRTTASKLQLPTKDEQKQLQQMDILMKTNILQLKVDSLLNEVSADKILIKTQVQAWIESVQSIINTDTKSIKLNEKWMNKEGFKGLELHNKDDSTLEIMSSKPYKMDVIGSSVYKTATNPILNIDIAVTIPNECFVKRDIIDHRYFDKRKLYLAFLYKILSKSNGDNLYEDIYLKAFKGDSRKPIIVLTSPFKKGGNSIVINLIPVISDTAFKVIQLRANKNNVRPPAWNSADGEGHKNISDLLTPTPLYNLAILEDMVLLTHHLIIQKILTHSTSLSLSQAIVLFKIWLTQRGIRFTVDGFDGHHTSLLLAYLVQTKRVSSNNSPLNIFQTMLTFIAEGHLNKYKLDFTKSEMIPHTSGGEDSMINVSTDRMKHSSILTMEMGDDFLRPLVLNHPVAGDICYNCFWRISSSSADILQNEAKRCLKELQSSQAVADSSSFELLFMSPRSFFESHDYFYHIHINKECIPYIEDCSREINKEDLQHIPALKNVQDMTDIHRMKLCEMLSHCLPYQHFSSTAVSVISKALGDRAIAVHSLIRSFTSTSDDLKEGHQSQNSGALLSDNFPKWKIYGEDLSTSSYIITIGIILDKEKLDRRVDKGPVNIDGSAIADIAVDPAFNKSNQNNENQELTLFRDFWGSKVELRRFKDGSIIEAVVWDAQPSVVDQVVRYTLGKHLPIICGDHGKDIYNVSMQLENILTTVSSGSDASNRLAITALDSLRGILTSKIKALPLALENVSAVSPTLRYTALNFITPHPIVSAGSKGSCTKNANANAKSNNSSKAIKSMLKQYAGQSISLLCPPIKIIVQIESSGKWPSNDTTAIRYTKTALLLQLKKELYNQLQISSIIHLDSLDICYEGFIFRMCLVATDDIENLLLDEDRCDELSILDHNNDKQNIQANNSFLRSLVIGRNIKIPPLHHSSIRSLRSQFPSYTGAVKLLTLWIAQNFLSGHICLELIELIVGYEYINPFSSTSPASATAGFYRALLRIADHNWESEPLIVDLSGDAKEISSSSAVMLEILTNFRSVRNERSENINTDENVNSYNQNFLKYMNLPMYVVSSVDKINKYWPSFKSPERVVLAMMIRLAKESAKQLLTWMMQNDRGIKQSSGLDESNQSWEVEQISNFMQSSAILSKCNCVLKFRKGISNLKPQVGPAFARLSVFANTPTNEASLSSLIVREGEWILNPIQEELIEKLRINFKNDALFFWNGLHGTELGILWRPNLKEYSNFSVLNSKCKAIIEQNHSSKTKNNIDKMKTEDDNQHHSLISNQVQTNFTEILAQIIDLSNGLLEISTIDEYQK